MVIERQGDCKDYAELYFAEPVHAGWLLHYFSGRNGGQLLVFNKDWKKLHLPVGIGEPGYIYRQHLLRVVLVDTAGGECYETTLGPAYDIENAPLEKPELLDCQGAPISAACQSLQSYFYACHHCPCHRKQDLREQCGLSVDDACEGDRFLIERITPLTSPDLILYSEVHSAGDLEDFLENGLSV